MFKKKRNALLGEMQEKITAERKAILSGLLDAGLVKSVEEEQVWGGFGPLMRKYSFTTDLVSRDEARKDAERAATRAVAAYKDSLRDKEWARRTREIEERDLSRRIAKGANEAIEKHLDQAAADSREAVDTALDIDGSVLLSAESIKPQKFSPDMIEPVLSAREVSLLIDERIAAAHERKTAALNAIYAEKKRRRDAKDLAERAPEGGAA